MYMYNLVFIALDKYLTIPLYSNNKENFEIIIEDILMIFSKLVGDIWNIQGFQQNTVEIKLKIDNIVSKYEKIYPELNRIPAFLRRLNEEENFFFFPNPEFEQ